MESEFLFFITLLALVLGYKLVKLYMTHHYQSLKAQDEVLTINHQKDLPLLYKQSLDAEERISNLEKILDTDLPGWRKNI